MEPASEEDFMEVAEEPSENEVCINWVTPYDEERRHGRWESYMEIFALYTDPEVIARKQAELCTKIDSGEWESEWERKKQKSKDEPERKEESKTLVEVRTHPDGRVDYVELSDSEISQRMAAVRGIFAAGGNWDNLCLRLEEFGRKVESGEWAREQEASKQ